MASEFVASLRPCDFQRETDLGNDPSVALVLTPGEADQSGTTAGDIRGLSLPRFVRGNVQNYGYTTTFRIPASLTLATGLTFKVYLSDDGKNAGDLGKAVELGITLKRLAADATEDVDVSAATEVTATATLSSTSGGISITSIAIANAALPASTAVGDLLLMRLRRIGANASDTCQGRALLIHCDVQNT